VPGVVGARGLEKNGKEKGKEKKKKAGAGRPLTNMSLGKKTIAPRRRRPSSFQVGPAGQAQGRTPDPGSAGPLVDGTPAKKQVGERRERDRKKRTTMEAEGPAPGALRCCPFALSRQGRTTFQGLIGKKWSRTAGSERGAATSRRPAGEPGRGRLPPQPARPKNSGPFVG